jgi:hypothetical protein
MPPSSRPSPDRHRPRVRELGDRAGGATGEALEEALNELYAALIALEAARTRARRELERAMAEALHPGGGERLHEQALTMRRLDRDVASLRAVLADLRALPAACATPRRSIR